MSKKLRSKGEEYKFNKFDVEAKCANGITLISLVITIIVLVILSAVAIYLSLGNNGIYTKAKEAKEITNKQEATDRINLKITTAQMNKYADEQRMPTLQELADVLYEDSEIQYVALETQVASKEKVTVGEKTSIFTKLNDYPYEFEINGQLQLASINGVQIATNTPDTNQATGMKTDVYIINSINSTGTYSQKTSMSGLTISKDENNIIDEYLAYSSEDGYTVLKSGWYFINLSTNNTPNNSYTYTIMTFLLNGTEMANCQSANDGYAANMDNNSFSVFLSKGDKFYFRATATGNNARARTAYASCRPMF